jgi:hypothetical protein
VKYEKRNIEAQNEILLHEIVEENEKLCSSGNDVDEVTAMLRGIPGCND